MGVRHPAPDLHETVHGAYTVLVESCMFLFSSTHAMAHSPAVEDQCLVTICTHEVLATVDTAVRDKLVFVFPVPPQQLPIADFLYFDQASELVTIL